MTENVIAPVEVPRSGVDVSVNAASWETEFQIAITVPALLPVAPITE